MRAAIIFSSLAVMAPLVVAQTPYYADQSAPFNLVLHSASTSLDGAALFSCHEGAAIEGLCVTTDFNPVEPVSPYNFNYSSLSTPDPVLGYQGLLTWELQAGSFNLSSPMALQNISDTNVENAFFEPSTTGTLVGFDQSNLLYILDDTTTEPGYSWYVCTVDYSYTYAILTWFMGRVSRIMRVVLGLMLRGCLSRSWGVW